MVTNDPSFDVVLKDRQMPVLDGLGATLTLTGPAAVVPIIGLTANASPEDAERCYAVGMNDFISKPVEFKRLLETMARLTTAAGRGQRGSANGFHHMHWKPRRDSDARGAEPQNRRREGE